MGRVGFKSKSRYEPQARASGSDVLVPWSKAEPQATRTGVDVTDQVQVGMSFGKTSDHGTGEPESNNRTCPGFSQNENGGGTDSDRGESPPESPPESSPESSVGNVSSASNRTDASICGCHGQVPPARARESAAEPRAKSLKQRPCPWHPFPASPPPPEAIRRRGETPVALYVRRPISRTPNNDNQIRLDDAHPP